MTMTDTESGRLPDVMPGHWDTPEGAKMAREYAAKDRTDLLMGDMSDLSLANAQYMQMRDSLLLGQYQTAAKERIRWLSARLAVAEATSPVGARDALVVVIGWLVEMYPTEQVMIQKLQVLLSRLEQAQQS